MRNKNADAFLKTCLSALISLSGALLAAAALLTVTAFMNSQGTFGDALLSAFRQGLFPMLTSGWKEGLFPEIVRAIPLALLSCAVAVPWRAGLYNLGGAGQYFTGFCCAALVIGFFHLPWYLGLLAAALSGALLGALLGWIRGSFHAHEGLVSMLMNWALLYGVRAAMQSFSWQAGDYPEIPLAGTLVGLGVCLITFVFLRFSVPGYQMKTFRQSEKLSLYAGMKPKKIAVCALCLSGFMAALAGGLGLLMSGGRELPGLKLALTGPGLWAILSCALAGGHPLGAALTGLLVSHLVQGGAGMDGNLYPSETVEITMAAALFLCTFVRNLIGRKGGYGDEL